MQWEERGVRQVVEERTRWRERDRVKEERAVCARPGLSPKFAERLTQADGPTQ